MIMHTCYPFNQTLHIESLNITKQLYSDIFVLQISMNVLVILVNMATAQMVSTVTLVIVMMDMMEIAVIMVHITLTLYRYCCNTLV